MSGVSTAGQTGDPAGFIIAGPGPAQGLVADWDGDIHLTRESGTDELMKCHAAGYDTYRLYALHIPGGLADAEKRAEDRIVAWLRRFSPAVGRKLPAELADAIERGEHR